MELSPSWECDGRSAAQQFLSFVYNQNVNYLYRVQKTDPLIPILNQMTPTNTIPSAPSEICHFCSFGGGVEPRPLLANCTSPRTMMDDDYEEQSVEWLGGET
jgi:hypothetical protein